MRWVRWGAVNYAILLGLLLAGAVLLIPAALVGWGERDELAGSYFLPAIYFPFTGLAYLVFLGLIASGSPRPRMWAVLLLPLFWAAVPVFALLVVVPGVVALWVVIAVYAAIVRLPPDGGRGGPSRRPGQGPAGTTTGVVPVARSGRTAWLGWAAGSLALLALVMVVGLALLVPARLAGWGDRETRQITYFYLWLYLPLTGPLYLLVLSFAARRVRHPRRWAVGLSPLLFAFVPVVAIGVTLPGVAATWVAYLAYGALVRLPPGPTPPAPPPATRPPARAPRS